MDAHPKSCLWNGCRFKGKNQTNKSSLVAHMRSHTGEKLHWCRLPECDKVFSRADALNKHERTVHTDAASKTNVAPKWTEQNTPAGSSSSSRKRKASPTPQDEGAAMGAGDSDLSDIDEPMLKRRAATAGDEHPPASEDYAATAAAASSPPPQAQPLDDPEVAAAIASHPDDDADQIRCIVMLAKLQHIEEEQARLKVEREAVAASRDALWSAKEELLNQVCDVELECVVFCRLCLQRLSQLLLTYVHVALLSSRPNWQDSLGPKGEMPAMWSLVTRSTLRTHR